VTQLNHQLDQSITDILKSIELMKKNQEKTKLKSQQIIHKLRKNREDLIQETYNEAFNI
jgi:acetyl-CoA carboxylase alpha subunit